MEKEVELMLKHDLQVGNCIGKGGFGKCYLVKMSNYNVTFVCKAIQRDGSDEDSVKSWEMEYKALIQIINPYVVKMYDFWKADSYYFLVLEYCPNGSLKDYIKRNGRIEGNLLRRFVDEMISGFEFCHSLKISHHDIKPANILLDARNRIRITDFGLAQIGDSDVSKNFAGSFIYKAPELLLKKPYDVYKADVWSFGVTLYEMALGEPPWDGQTIREIIVEMSMGIDYANPSVPTDIYKLIKKCLQMNPEKRPSFTEMRSIVEKYHLPPLKQQRGKQRIQISSSLSSLMNSPSSPLRLSTKSKLSGSKGSILSK